MTILQSGIAKPSSGYDIEQSLRFDNSAYLSKTFASDGNLKTWTLSLWAKRAKLGVGQILFNAWEDDSNRLSVMLNSADKLTMY